jgi:NADPH:quinone reductase-like Zn-dependent oxidoreductase
MYAVRLHAFGPPENLRYETAEDPRPGPGQVRIAVGAAGVHLVDTLMRAGTYGGGPAPAPELPTIPGREVAGTVDALGAGADPYWLGRRVVAHLGTVPGGYAESAVTDTGRLHEVPDGLGLPEAIAMIGTGRTALGILHLAELTPEDTVVVLAAAGGIGTLVVQCVRQLGATVVGAAGGRAKTERVRALGADLAVDYSGDDWTAEVRGFLGAERPAGVVFDGVGGALAQDAFGLLRPGGRHLIYGWSSTPGQPTVFAESELSARGVGVEIVVGPALQRFLGTAERLRAVQAEALAAAAAGRLVPAVQTFPLADAAAAHAALEARATMGKVVLLP